MSETIQIDQAGRVVLPKRFRERFRLTGGATLTIEVKGDAIELRPAKATSGLKRVNGVLVVTSGDSLPAGQDFVTEEREARLDELIHRGKGEK